MPWDNKPRHLCGLKGRENLPPSRAPAGRSGLTCLLPRASLRSALDFCSAGPLGRINEPPDEYVFKLLCQSTNPDFSPGVSLWWLAG